MTSLVPGGPDLFVSTSAKWPAEWDANKFPFLAPDKWKSYGSVYTLTMPGHLSATTKWTDGPTTFDFFIRNNEISISQDGKRLAATRGTGTLTQHLNDAAELTDIEWGQGIYGSFRGDTIKGGLRQE